jgi:hypothetical protein
MQPPRAGELAWNPVTGERGVVLEGPEENDERRLVVELHVSPGGAVVGEHLHPAIKERFEVLEGRLEVKLAGKSSEAAVATTRVMTKRRSSGPPRTFVIAVLWRSASVTVPARRKGSRS